MGILKDIGKLCNRMAFFLGPKPPSVYEPVALTADIFVGAGERCRPVDMLVRSGLRFCSCPLDWMIYPLKSAERLYKNRFEDYFGEIHEDPHQSGARNNRRVVDTRNDIISIHHFPKHLPLDEGQALFRKISAARFRRLDDYFRQAKRVAFVSFRTESLEDIAAFTRTLQDIDGFHASHINVRDAAPADKCLRELHLNDKVHCYEYQFPDSGDEEAEHARSALLRKYEWMRILKRCSVTDLLPRPEFRIAKRNESWGTE